MHQSSSILSDLGGNLLGGYYVPVGRLHLTLPFHIEQIVLVTFNAISKVLSDLGYKYEEEILYEITVLRRDDKK